VRTSAYVVLSTIICMSDKRDYGPIKDCYAVTEYSHREDGPCYHPLDVWIFSNRVVLSRLRYSMLYKLLRARV
jgi:hypothetical protein